MHAQNRTSTAAPAAGREQGALDGPIVELIPALRAFAWTLVRNHQQVDDLVQETLMKALANVHRFEPGTNLRSWLFTIMRNSFYNNIKISARERTGAADCVSSEVISSGTQEWSLRGSEVVEAIRHIPEPYRETLILVVALGESYKSAARICNCAVGTVKSRVSRARVLVMEELGETSV